MKYISLIIVSAMLVLNSCTKEEKKLAFDSLAIGNRDYTISERDIDSILIPGTEMVFQELTSGADSFPVPRISQKTWDLSNAVASGPTDTVFIRPGDPTIAGSFVSIEEQVSTADFASSPSLPMKFKQTYYLAKIQGGVRLVGQGISAHQIRTSPNASHGLVFPQQKQVWDSWFSYYPTLPIQDKSLNETRINHKLMYDFNITTLGWAYNNQPATLVCSLAYAGAECLATGVMKLPGYSKSMRVLLVDRGLFYYMNFTIDGFRSLPSEVLQLYGLESNFMNYQGCIDVINPGGEGIVARMYYIGSDITKVFVRLKQ